MTDPGLTFQPEEIKEEQLEKYLVFQVAEQSYGISIANVVEIVQMQPVTPMPELPSYAKGVINLRGSVIPLVDLSMRFGKGDCPVTERTCIVIVTIDGRSVGLIVSEVTEVLDISAGQISPPPLLGETGGRFVIGIARLEMGMVLLFEPRLVLSDEDLQVMQSMT